MTATAQLAYGNARVRARKSRVVSAATLVTLAAAERLDRTVDGWSDLDVDGDAASLLAALYVRLTDDYDATIRAYPSAASLLRALVRRHELENVKLAWRAVVHGVEPAGWQALWRPMGRVESISRDRCTAVSSPAQLAAALSRTPFGVIADVVLRTHLADLAASEMAFDRWASDTIAKSANALPKCERVAHDLVCRIVCERDVEVLQRAIGSLGLAPLAAVRLTSMLAGVLGSAGARQLSEWSNAGGAPLRLPVLLSTGRASVRTFTELHHLIRATLRAACQRVFLGNPFSLAPAIALVLLREDELGALISIGELRARHLSGAEAARVLGFNG